MSEFSASISESLDEAMCLIEDLRRSERELEIQNAVLSAELELGKQQSIEFLRERDNARMFMSAIDQSSESIFFTDIKGHILYVNRSFERTSGYTREELIGNTPRLLKSGKHSREDYKKMGQSRI